MKSNPFKALHAFTLTAQKDGDSDVFRLLQSKRVARTIEENAEVLHATDPTGGQWRAGGLIHVQASYAHDLDGGGLMFCVQINERNLPAKTRDEHLAIKLNHHFEQTGRAAGKKEYAEYRDQVEFELLPKAFIKRTNIYLVVTPESKLLAFSGSAKKCEDAIGVVLTLLSQYVEDIYATPLQFKNNVVGLLNAVVRDGLDSERFFAGNSMVLKGIDKRSIRIKDRDTGSQEIQDLLGTKTEDGFAYDVHELQMEFYGEDEVDPRSGFVFNHKHRFSNVKLADTTTSGINGKSDDAKTAFHSVAWMHVREARDLIDALSDELGGEAQSQPASSNKPATDEDDEI